MRAAWPRGSRSIFVHCTVRLEDTEEELFTTEDTKDTEENRPFISISEKLCVLCVKGFLAS